MSTRNAHRSSIEDPESYWRDAAEAVDWSVFPTRILNFDQPPFARWFEGGVMNTCHNAVDRHVDAGRGAQPAFIYDSPLAGEQRVVTYAELRSQVSRFAGALRELGVGKGDRVIIYMPMVPETAVAMLACARLGAVHSVVFGGFASAQLAARIDDAKPKVVVCGACGLEPGRVVPYKELVDHALAQSRHEVSHVVVLQRPQSPATLHEGRDLDWHELLERAEPAPCVDVPATHPLYILYTSGTTGAPKGIVRDHGGHAVALLHSMQHIFDIAPGEVFWAASDFGWAVGHSYAVYAPLLRGATSVIYEGKPVGTPDAGAFFRVLEAHRVVTMFTAPTAYRAIKRADPQGDFKKRHPLPHLRALFLAGERCDPDTLGWAQRLLGVKVIDHWWQTETGSPITASPRDVPVKAGSAGLPMPGFDLHVLDAEARDVAPGEPGTLALKLPLPPGCLPTLWNDDARFVKSYVADYPGYYTTADAGFIDAEGYAFVMGRTDDIINVAGHRLSTGEMEEVLASHPAVAECAVVGVRDELKGELPVGLLVLKVGAHDAQRVTEEVVELIRDKVGPVAAFKRAVVVAALPKTRSGKILRRTLRELLNGDAWQVPATTEDAGVLETLARQLAPR